MDLPGFGFAENQDLTPVLEEMGLHKEFDVPDAFSAMKKGRKGFALTGFSQTLQIHVDPEGIRVDAVIGAEGLLGGILGGTIGPPAPHFHMVVNRPFLFFVHDNLTGSLVFEGAVMDPQPAN